MVNPLCGQESEFVGDEKRVELLSSYFFSILEWESVLNMAKTEPLSLPW